MEQGITLDPQAAEKVAEFMTTSEADESTCLRLGVRGGGCSGYQYQLALDEKKDNDLLFVSHGQQVIVSKDALPLVQGSTIIWVESLMTSGFDVKNPNATAACGCGSSFRVDPDAVGCSEASGPSAEDSIY